MLFNNQVKQSPIIGLAGLGGGISSYVFLSAGGAYEIARSLRFNSADSAYLSRTPASAGNRKTWTWAGWVKRSKLGISATLFASRPTSSPLAIFYFSDQDYLRFDTDSNSFGSFQTNAVFRDCSAWYHIVLAADSSQATDTNRLKLYVNGVQQTFASATYPSQNTDGQINTATLHGIGAINPSTYTDYFDGYLADVWFIDGQALSASSFGEFDATTGVWNPKRYTGAKSGNSFHLPFSDNTSTTTLGYDDSGNNNNWTVNNIVASGSNNNTLSSHSHTGTTQADPTSNFLDGDTTSYRVSATFSSGLRTTTASFTFGTSLSGTLEVLYSNGNDQVTGSISIDGGSNFTALGTYASPTWISIGTISGNNVQIRATYNYGGGSTASFYGIRVNGTEVLTDFSPKSIDSLLDSPSNDTDTGTGIGGEITGNYCTWNPLDTWLISGSLNLANGNLDCTPSATNSWKNVRSTISAATGKWYFELTVLATGTNTEIGVFQTNTSLSVLGSSDPYAGRSASAWVYQTNGTTYNNNSGTAYTSSSAGDVVMVAFDVDAGKIWFGKNGTWFNSGNPGSGSNAIYTNLTGALSPILSIYNASESCAANFGQRDFAYDAPTGFKSLNTAELPTPTIEVPSDYVGVTTYTGNGSTQIISGLGFSPDLVIIKRRSASENWTWTDTVRGATKAIYSNLTNAEGTDANGLTAFNSDGFNIGSDSAYNFNTSTYVSYAWKAGGAPTTDNVAGAGNVPTAGSAKIDGANMTTSLAGSIAATRLSVNTTSGFSIVTYTGNGSNSTVGHGLGVTPSLVIVKKRSSADAWIVWFNGFTSNEYLYLNSTAAKGSYSGTWGSTPTSSVFGVYDQSINANGSTFVAYCFAPVAGYSAFGSYTGNGSTDGPFVYTGFRPRWIMVKRSDSGANDWYVLDTARSTYNVAINELLPNSSSAENPYTGVDFDLLSNGFKIRATEGSINASGGTFIFAAFAESPFLTQARAR